MQPGGGGWPVDARARRDRTIAGVLWAVAAVLVVVIAVGLLGNDDDDEPRDTATSANPSSTVGASTTTGFSITTTTTTVPIATSTTTTAPATTTAVADTTVTTVPGVGTTTPAVTSGGVLDVPTNVGSSGELEVDAGSTSNGPERAFDRDLTTAWVSTGDAELRWRMPGGTRLHISQIILGGNFETADAAQRQLGFGKVTVTVYDGDGTSPVYTQSGDLPGTVDEGLFFEPNLAGTLVVMSWSNPDDGQSGAVSEIEIYAVPTPPVG